MAGGFVADNKLFLTIDLDVLGEEKLNALQKQLMATDNVAQKSGQGMNQLAGQTKEAGNNADRAGGQFGKMFGIGMNVMFLGMALNMVFGRMARQMLKMTGASAAMGSAMKMVLLPFFMAITPLIIKLSSALMDLPRPIKMVAGALVALLTVLGIVTFFGAQLFLLTTQISLSFAGLLTIIGSLVLAFGVFALALIFVQRAMNGTKPVLNALIAILAGSLLAIMSPIVGAAVALLGVFAGLTGIFKKFGKVVGTIVSAAVAAVGLLVAVFVSVPAGIALAVTAILAVIWNFRDEIINTLQNIGQWIANLPNWFSKRLGAAGRTVKKWGGKIVGFFGDLWKGGKKQLGNLIDFITSLPQKILDTVSNVASAMAEMGEELVNGVVDGINAVGDSIADAFFGFLPGPLASAVKGVSKFSGGLVNRITDVISADDFILTDGGKMIQPDKNDTIVGFNGNGPIQPGAGGGEVTVNINDPVMKEDVDVQSVVDEVEDRVDRNTRGRSGGLT